MYIIYTVVNTHTHKKSYTINTVMCSSYILYIRKFNIQYANKIFDTHPIVVQVSFSERVTCLSFNMRNIH